MTEWEVLDTGRETAKKIMECDAELLESLTGRSQPLIHFYDWEGDAATYGYFVDPSRFLKLDRAEKRGVELARRPTGGGIVLGFLAVLFMVVVIGSFPATWLLMLFLGNIGVNVGFWGTLPAGILLTFFVAGTGGMSRMSKMR